MSGISAERLATFTYEELVRRAGNRVYPTTSHRQSECWTDEGRGSLVRTYTYSGSDSEEGDDGQEPALRLDLSEEELLELASPSPHRSEYAAWWWCRKGAAWLLDPGWFCRRRGLLWRSEMAHRTSPLLLRMTGLWIQSWAALALPCRLERQATTSRTTSQSLTDVLAFAENALLVREQLNAVGGRRGSENSLLS